MINNIRLHRGLDIPLNGMAQQKIWKTIIPDVIAVKPTDFKFVMPKLLVKEGDTVKAGQFVFTDKYRPEIGFSAPCSGKVKAIVRGEKRKLLAVEITPDSTFDYINFEAVKDVEKASREDLTKKLLDSGLWASIIQRPYGVIANPKDTPKAIVISAFNSAPLAANINFTMKDEIENMQTGIDALAKFTNGKIYVNLDAKDYAASPLYKLNGVEKTCFEGPHPAGNVGVQIHHLCPIGKGEIVWTIKPVQLAAIGKFFKTGIYDLSRLVAIAGTRVENPAYVKCIPGISMHTISDAIGSKKEEKICGAEVGIRYISGNVLDGENVGPDGYLGFYDDQITLISEGNYREMFGWAKIFRPKKFSFSRTYLSFLTPNKKYNPDTNLNGGVRPFVVTGLYEKVVPMDIYPVYLLKAILAEDIDKMEQLGIYEVIGEDLALCEYVCPSKINVQEIVDKGISLMIKEMA
ncbi:MAG: Na(+)-translocating NADH-quinone reductase subunit A [Bacteroidales bacterium]|jgi:Na+-transporting NADH:ubiquinone oxidoreductase subunit A|nr:Na(+)-translocating NADH-quinone reductase subunit A [Bacteroidales bacterium]MCI1734062.1 Na(+)-translocating NADH-quinone reductase subunit A [Bacteroidales bacterium]